MTLEFETDSGAIVRVTFSERAARPQVHEVNPAHCDGGDRKQSGT